MTKFDPTKPVKTRDGRKARIICTDRKDAYPIVALIDFGGDERVESFTAAGTWSLAGSYGWDLVNVPEPVVSYINAYEGGVVSYGSEEQADKCAAMDRLALLKLTYTPGEGAEVEVVKEFK